MDPYVVGVSGASGAALAHRAIDWLIDAGYPLVVTASRTAHQIWADELGESFEGSLRSWRSRGEVRHYAADDFGAPIASGSFPIAGMLIIPCSMATVAGLANGYAANLMLRAGDCCLKEGRRLVLVPRETPLSAIHLENLLKLARLGVRIVPPVPAFYTHPRDVADIVAQIAGRALAALGLDSALDRRYVYAGTHTGDEDYDAGDQSPRKEQP